MYGAGACTVCATGVGWAGGQHHLEGVQSSNGLGVKIIPQSSSFSPDALEPPSRWQECKEMMGGVR